MKKFNKIIIAIMLISIVALCLFACTNPGNVDDHGSMTLVVLNGDQAKEYTVDLTTIGSGDTYQTGLMVVLEYLKNKGELTYTAQEGEYGAFLTQVNELQQDAANGVYLYLYTDVETDIDVSEWATTKEYNGKTLTSSGVGASSMNVVDGCTILITTIVS